MAESAVKQTAALAQFLKRRLQLLARIGRQAVLRPDDPVFPRLRRGVPARSARPESGPGHSD